MKIIIYVLIADFLTGLFHWLEDTYGTLNWVEPLKTQVVIPNIEHHKNPSLMGKMGTIFSRNYQQVLLAVAIYLPFWFFGYGYDLLIIGMIAAIGNEVHAWNHRDNNNYLITFLQDSCLIQTKRQHNLHHKPPYNKYYCTLTNVTNAILERIYFWRCLEFILDKIGIKIKRCSDDRRGF